MPDHSESRLPQSLALQIKARAHENRSINVQDEEYLSHNQFFDKQLLSYNHQRMLQIKYSRLNNNHHLKEAVPLALMTSQIQAKLQQKNHSIEKRFEGEQYARSINLSPRFENS